MSIFQVQTVTTTPGEVGISQISTTRNVGITFLGVIIFIIVIVFSEILVYPWLDASSIIYFKATGLDSGSPLGSLSYAFVITLIVIAILFFLEHTGLTSFTSEPEVHQNEKVSN